MSMQSFALHSTVQAAIISISSRSYRPALPLRGSRKRLKQALKLSLVAPARPITRGRRNSPAPGKPKVVLSRSTPTAIPLPPTCWTVPDPTISRYSHLRACMGLTMLFISHDLVVGEFMCYCVVILHLGRIMHIAPSEELCASPRLRYTRALFPAIPLPDPNAPHGHEILTGGISSLTNSPSGCVFRTRCPFAFFPFAFSRCAEAAPSLDELGPGHFKVRWLRTVPPEVRAATGGDRRRAES